jgi:hypothetical protein
MSSAIETISAEKENAGGVRGRKKPVLVESGDVHEAEEEGKGQETWGRTSDGTGGSVIGN